MSNNIVGYLYTFDDYSELLMPDEVEPGNFKENPQMYQAVVLAGQCFGEMNCGMSWSGNNVHGNSQSIEAVKDVVHYAGQVPELKERIAQLQTKNGILSNELLRLEGIISDIDNKRLEGMK